MKFVFIVVILGAALGIRIWLFKARGRGLRFRKSATPGEAATVGTEPVGGSPGGASAPPNNRRGDRIRRAADDALGPVGSVALREIRERVKGRIFRVGTILALVAVGLAIVIPSLHKTSSGPTAQAVGVVGKFSPETARIVHAYAEASGDSVTFVPEPSMRAASAELRSGKLAFAIVDSREIVLNLPAANSNSPADPTLVQDVAEYLGVVQAYRAAGLSPTQAMTIDRSKPVPVRTLQPGPQNPIKAVSVIGIILLFIMLTQYNTWILMGVMQEKSSRVVEVLLATLRPLQLLGGKVLGIGLVALGQATVIVGFALAVGAAVGSDVLKGTGIVTLLAELLWFVLGYAFYCWVYAAAGSTAERQDQVQTLALPLSIPILLGYIIALTTASTGTPSTFFEVLAYLPPTAPFCMSVLVGLGQAQWWQFLASVLATLAGTAGMAIVAARIYRRAVLQTGGRVHLRSLFTHAAR